MLFSYCNSVTANTSNNPDDVHADSCYVHRSTIYSILHSLPCKKESHLILKQFSTVLSQIKQDCMTYCLKFLREVDSNSYAGALRNKVKIIHL